MTSFRSLERPGLIKEYRVGSGDLRFGLTFLAVRNQIIFREKNIGTKPV